MRHAIPLALSVTMGLLAVPGPVWGAGCKQEIEQVKTAVAKNPPPENSADHGKTGLTENWFGGTVGAPRARELLFNAGRLADNGKEASCNELVAEAKRAVGMLHETK